MLHLQLIALEASAITWSTVWGEFQSAWTSVSGFMATNSVFLTIIGVPIVAGIIGVIAHAIR